MPSSDHLDKETSISVALTESGIEAKAKSRFIAAVDRLAGNVVDVGNVWIEAATSRRRARTEGEKHLIEATAKYAVERLGRDEEFAARALDTHFKRVARDQLNKDAVLAEALDELASQPQREGTEGNISDQFFDRFERYAAEASTDELRQRWGRVLASEIRKPGTFSAKVLRVIDELDGDTARVFEGLCSHRLKQVLPKCLLGELQFVTVAALTTAGLILEPGLGQRGVFTKATDSKGKSIWLSTFGELAVGFPDGVSPPRDKTDQAAIASDGKEVWTPVYVLTDEGVAISSILPDNSSAAFSAYVNCVHQALPEVDLTLYQKTAIGEQTRFVLIGSVAGSHAQAQGTENT